MNKRQLLNEFVTEHLDSACRFAYVYVKNQQDAEDVVAESVEKALRNINALRDPDKIRAWFYKIIVNTSINHLKKQSKTVPVWNDFPTESEHVVWDDYSELHFNDILNILSADERAIIVLRFFEERKISEISEILDMNENTVKTRLYRALEKLKIEISGEEARL